MRNKTTSNYLILVGALCLLTAGSNKLKDFSPQEFAPQTAVIDNKQSSGTQKNILPNTNTSTSTDKTDSLRTGDDVKPKISNKLKDYKPLEEGVRPNAGKPILIQQKAKISEPVAKENISSQTVVNAEPQKKLYKNTKNVNLKNFTPLHEKPVTNWEIKELPHFKLYYEETANSIAGTISAELEKIYSSMRLNVALFIPWIDDIKPKIYLYANKDSYLAGEFKPKEWYEGHAYTKEKIVVVFYSGDFKKIKSKLAHELSHIYFESFYNEKGKSPVLWINEGLAVYMESLTQGKDSDWELALGNFPDNDRFTFPEYFSSDLQDLPDEEISYWYLQAFGIVKYLNSVGTKLSFKNFCEKLRDGVKVESALWEVYRLQNASVFSGKWNSWVSKYKQQNTTGGNSGINSITTFSDVTPVFTDFNTGRSENQPLFKKRKSPGFRK